MKKIIFIIILAILLSSTLAASYPLRMKEFNQKDKQMEQLTYNYTDISAQEAWDMLENPNDGHQIPIDMRRWDEYISERIQVPNENDWPRWFPYEFTSGGPGPIKNEGVLLDLFMSKYNDKEIIIYCRTGRRTGLAAEILMNHGFSGVLYNMQDGITEWKAIGLPTVQGFIN